MLASPPGPRTQGAWPWADLTDRSARLTRDFLPISSAPAFQLCSGREGPLYRIVPVDQRARDREGECRAGSTEPLTSDFVAGQPNNAPFLG